MFLFTSALKRVMYFDSVPVLTWSLHLRAMVAVVFTWNSSWYSEMLVRLRYWRGPPQLASLSVTAADIRSD